MDNDSVVEQIVKSLSFEVEAIPQDNVIHLTTSTKSAPLNVKIRVRKKEEASFKHGVMSLPKPDRPDGIPERVRLVSSDQTIMSFNVVMEADFEKPVKKPRKNILGIFKPTMCLGTQPDEDDYAYLPSNSYTASINKESTSKSEGALTKFTLSRSVDGKETASTLPKRKKDIFGKCKPGGCLDPPFGEDKQAYIPANVDGQASKTGANVTKTDKTAKSTAERARTSSVFSNKLFNWKRKSSNEEALDDNVIKTKNRAESVLDLYQAGSVPAPTDYSNSIMTYPPTLNSSEHLRINEEKQRSSRTYNDTPRNSFSAHSGSYFIMPRKPKYVLDRNNTTKIEDDSDIKMDATHKNSEDQNVIAERLSFKDDETKQTKQILRTGVTDDRGGTEENFMEPSESKTKHNPNREHFVDSSNPLLTEIGSKHITMQEDLSIPNLNFVPDSMIQNKKSVESNKSLTKEYSSEYNAEPTAEMEKTIRVVNENKLLKAVNDHGSSTSLKELNYETDIAIKNVIQTPIKDDNKTGDKSVMAADAQHKKSNYDSTSGLEANSKTDLTLQTENRTLDKGLKDEELMEIPTPIKRDTSLELINVKDDDLKQVWKNMIANSLTSGTTLEPENEHTKQDNMVTAPNNEYTKQDTMTDEFKNEHTEQDTIIDESENQHIKQDTVTYYEPKNEYIKQNNMINEPGNERTEQDNMINEPENERTGQDNMINEPKNERTEQDNMINEPKNERTEQDNMINEPKNERTEQDNMINEPKNERTEQDNMINEPKNERTEQDNMINEPKNERTEQDNMKNETENERTEQDNVINEPESEHTQLDNLINERENVYAKQSNMKYDLNNKTEILDETSAKELFDQTEAQTILSKDKLSKPIEHDYKTETQYGNDKIQGMISTATANDPLERKVGQNALFENNSPILDKIDEIDSVASQNLEDISFTTQTSNPSLVETEYEENSEATVIGEYVTNPVTEQPQINVKDIIDFPQTSEAITEQAQLEATFNMAPDKRKISDGHGANTQSEAYFNIAPDKGKISDDQSANIQSEASYNIKEKKGDDHGAHLENNNINGFDKKKYEADAVNDGNKGETKHEQQKVNVDKINEKITDQKKPDEKHLLFNEDINEAKYNSQTEKNLQSEFNLDRKADNQKTEKGSEIGFDRSFSNEQNKTQTQTSEIRPKHKARPILFNLAIQSYVDDDKQVIIKSFDSDVAPQRYLHDSVRITRRYLNRDDRIQIPIDSENDLYVQIKSKAQIDNSGREGNNMDQDITKKSAEKKYESEIDHIKRNVIIAEDIRRTLEAIYEKELLPLRNTISELKENMEVLTIQHMVLKGHMFIKKPMSSKLVPLFRKCGCMKK